MVVLLFIILNFYRSVVNECCGFEGDDSDSGTSYEDYGDEDEDDAFDDDDDPYQERDFAALEVEGTKVYFKFDYYNLTMDRGSEDPADPAQTVRVLTVMLPSEY